MHILQMNLSISSKYVLQISVYERIFCIFILLMLSRSAFLLWKIKKKNRKNREWKPHQRNAKMYMYFWIYMRLFIFIFFFLFFGGIEFLVDFFFWGGGVHVPRVLYSIFLFQYYVFIYSTTHTLNLCIVYKWTCQLALTMFSKAQYMRVNFCMFFLAFLSWKCFSTISETGNLNLPCRCC